SRGTSSPEKGGHYFGRLKQTGFEEICADRSAGVCPCGRFHGRRRPSNHFEIDPGLGESFGLFIGLREGKKANRSKPHNLMSFPRCRDKQGINSLLETARLHAELVDTAHLRRGGDQVKDFL